MPIVETLCDAGLESFVYVGAPNNILSTTFDV